MIIKDKLKKAFEEQFGDCENLQFVCAPGRVNLIGEHTDYNNGFVLPMTINRAVYIAIRCSSKPKSRIYSLNFKEEFEFTISQITKNPSVHWSSYVKGVFRELFELSLLKENTHIEAVIWGDIPTGTGLSSSAALEISMAYALQALFQFELKPIEMIKLCQKVEHIYAGVQCGIMDQFVSRLGKTNKALFLDCQSLEYKDVPMLLEGFNLVIANTGVKRKLADSKYNERRAECEEGIKYFHKYNTCGRTIKSLRDIELDLFDRYSHELPKIILQRCRHVITENSRVLQALNYLNQNDLQAFGKLMNSSHDSLRDNYEVSCDELDVLVEAARSCPGVLGSRMTGAGFGGCTVSLIKNSVLEEFLNKLTERYKAEFKFEPTFYTLDCNLETTQF